MGLRPMSIKKAPVSGSRNQFRMFSILSAPVFYDLLAVAKAGLGWYNHDLFNDGKDFSHGVHAFEIKG